LSKITHNKDSGADLELNALLNEALPEPPLPDYLERQILDQVRPSSEKQYGYFDRALDWIIGDAHWWRPASAGLMMLIVGYGIGVATPLDQSSYEVSFEASFSSGHLITLNEEYEVYNDAF